MEFIQEKLRTIVKLTDSPTRRLQESLMQIGPESANQTFFFFLILFLNFTQLYQFRQTSK